MRCFERLVVLSLKIFIFFLFVGASFAATTIKLKSQVYTNKENIYLSDIAVVSSDNSKFKEFLENLYITDFPQDIFSKRITKKQIKDILEANYINTSEISIVGSYCTIKRSINKLTPEKIKDDVQSFLLRRYPDIEVVSISVPRIRSIQRKNLRIKIKERSKTSSYIYLTYFVYNGNFLLRRISVPVKYKKISYVVFSVVDIRKGEYITREKISLKKYTGNTRHLFTSLEEILGKKAKINIKADIPIKDYMIVPDYLVQRGSNVKIIYNKGIIHIELIGRALENGQLNQIIKVKNISSGKVIPCKVIGRNQVLFIGGSF